MTSRWINNGLRFIWSACQSDSVGLHTRGASHRRVVLSGVRPVDSRYFLETCTTRQHRSLSLDQREPPRFNRSLHKAFVRAGGARAHDVAWITAATAACAPRVLPYDGSCHATNHTW